MELIRRISGHAPDSKVLYLYLRYSPETVAMLIKDNSPKSKEILKQYYKAQKIQKNNKRY